MKSLVGICAAYGILCAAQAVTVDLTASDPLADFVAKDLSRLLGGKAEKITLRIDASLPAQGWRLKSGADGSLVIYGRDALGIANGAYNFLEKYAGVNWFAPDTECVPDLTGWKLPTGLDETRQPAFSQREMFVSVDFMDSTWRLRNRESNRAMFVGYVGGSPFNCHTFGRYAKELGQSELCTSDPKTRERVAERMCRYIEEDRERIRKSGRSDYCVPTVYDLSQNDGGSGGCKCPECRKLADAAGSYSGPNIDFVSDVARRVAKRHPEIQVQTFAYSYTQNPPTNDLVAADNVNVRYCCSWVFDPLLPGTPQGDKLVRWTKHAKHFGVWAYGRTYRGVLFPFIHKRMEMAEELRFCRRLGVERYYCENEAPLSRSFAMLQHWLFLKLAEDPSQDPIALSKEFLAGYYGAAAKPVGEYLDYLERRQKTGVGCLDNPQRQHLDREFFEKVNGWLDEAERLVKDDPRSLQHVHWERVIVDRSMYDVVGSLTKQGYVYDAKKVAARFAANARELIETWGELNVPERKDQKAKRLRDIEIESDLYAHYPIPMPGQFKGMDVEVLEWNKIAPPNAKLVKDPEAAAGTAFTHPEFGDRFPFLTGFFNPISKEKGLLSFKSRADVPQDEKYHFYRLGRATIITPLYLHYSASAFRGYLTTLGIVPEERDIWLSVKFQGPTFVAGSTKENAILIDRAFEVKEDASRRESGDVGRYDRAMAQEKVAAADGLQWIDGTKLPIEGRAFDDTEHYYDRLPSNVTAAVNAGVRNMKHHTSGMQFRFTTDSRKLRFRWSVYYTNHLEMQHMPRTGVSGIDVYFQGRDGRWLFKRSGCPAMSTAKGGDTFEFEMPCTPGTPCLVNLPLYNGIRCFSLGIEQGCSVKPLPPRRSGVVKPVVFYGTSITHGGCCSRPGMAFPSIVGRQLDVPIVNLGFSGSGRMEFEMSEHLARIDASCYVLDCLWNMGGDRWIKEKHRERYEPFIRNLRAKRPDVPIVMAEHCDVFCNGPDERDRFIKDLYDKLVAEGWKNLVYLPNKGMYPGDLEGTVDGAHASDYGMLSLAKAFGGAVGEALGLEAGKK